MPTKIELREQHLAPNGSLPPEIKAAVKALILPYGLDIDALLKNPQNIPDEQSGKKYFSVKEAEEYSSVSRYTLHRAVQAGFLSVHKLSRSKNGKVLIEKKELDRWLETKLVTKTKAEVTS